MNAPVSYCVKNRPNAVGSTALGIDRQRLTERLVGGKIGEAVEGEGARLRRSEAESLGDPPPLEADANRVLAAVERQDVAQLQRPQPALIDEHVAEGRRDTGDGHLRDDRVVGASRRVGDLIGASESR